MCLWVTTGPDSRGVAVHDGAGGDCWLTIATAPGSQTALRDHLKVLPLLGGTRAPVWTSARLGERGLRTAGVAAHWDSSWSGETGTR